jgi:hypothetical protein
MKACSEFAEQNRSAFRGKHKLLDQTIVDNMHCTYNAFQRRLHNIVNLNFGRSEVAEP